MSEGSKLNPDARAFSPGGAPSGGQRRQQRGQQQYDPTMRQSSYLGGMGGNPMMGQMGMGMGYGGMGYGMQGGGYGAAQQMALAQQQHALYQQAQQAQRPQSNYLPNHNTAQPKRKQATPKKAATSPVDQDLNPSARPFLPASHQSTRSSSKPVILFLGPPGAGITQLTRKLADKMGAMSYSSSEVRKMAQHERERKFDNRPVSSATWVEVQDTISGLRELLTKTAKEPNVKGYLLDITCRNNAIFHFISELLKEFGLAPGCVVHVTSKNTPALIKTLTAAGEGETTARKQIDHYQVSLKERLSMFDGVKGLVTTVDGNQAEEKVLADASAAVSLVFQNVLSFSIPYPSPSSGLTPILGIEEYVHVLNTLSDKLSGGDVRFPGTKESGQLALADGKLVNLKGEGKEKPSAATHVASKKTDGVRYLLVYTSIPGNDNRGRLYLVPKSMEMVFVFSPRIADMILESGNAPLYGESGSLTTWVLDGELVATKSGWGGLQGMGCKQLLYIASDVMYFAAERPRDRFVSSAHWTLERRLEVLSRLGWPTEEQAPHDTTNVSLCTKSYYPLHKLPALVANVMGEGSSYTSTGIVFTPRRRYVPYTDPELCSWLLFKHKRLHLRVREKAGGVSTAYEVFAKKGWASDDEVKVGDVVSNDVHSGNVSVRVEWETVPGGDYKWVICGPAGDCWEESAVKAYLNKSHWVAHEELLSELYTEPPKEPEKKVRVEPAKEPAEESAEEEETQARASGGRGGGRGGGGQ